MAKLAVPEQHRRRGFGRLLMLWAQKQARENMQISSISLSALPEAVKFYQRLGFKKLHEITSKDDELALFPGQVYMELSTRRGKKPKSGGRR